jgi:hypothetical protein
MQSPAPQRQKSLWHSACIPTSVTRERFGVKKILPAKAVKTVAHFTGPTGTEIVMDLKKLFLMLLVLGGIGFTQVGCEADGDIDDDGAKLKVDVDD